MSELVHVGVEYISKGRCRPSSICDQERDMQVVR